MPGQRDEHFFSTDSMLSYRKGKLYVEDETSGKKRELLVSDMTSSDFRLSQRLPKTSALDGKSIYDPKTGNMMTYRWDGEAYHLQVGGDVKHSLVEVPPELSKDAKKGSMESVRGPVAWGFRMDRRGILTPCSYHRDGDSAVDHSLSSQLYLESPPGMADIYHVWLRLAKQPIPVEARHNLTMQHIYMCYDLFALLEWTLPVSLDQIKMLEKSTGGRSDIHTMLDICSPDVIIPPITPEFVWFDGKIGVKGDMGAIQIRVVKENGVKLDMLGRIAPHDEDEATKTRLYSDLVFPTAATYMSLHESHPYKLFISEKSIKRDFKTRWRTYMPSITESQLLHNPELVNVLYEIESDVIQYLLHVAGRKAPKSYAGWLKSFAVKLQNNQHLVPLLSDDEQFERVMSVLYRRGGMEE